MKKFFRYFSARIKSHIKSSPLVILIALLTAASVAVLASAVIKHAAEDDERNALFKVGITGDLDQKYVDLVIDTMIELDSSKMAINFEKIEKVDDAEAALKSGDIMGYILIPERFVEYAQRGEFIPAKYVTEGTDVAFGDKLIAEFMSVVERLAKEVQGEVFGFDDYLRSVGASSKEAWD